jgi:hypothetical protein
MTAYLINGRLSWVQGIFGLQAADRVLHCPVQPRVKFPQTGKAEVDLLAASAHFRRGEEGLFT